MGIVSDQDMRSTTRFLPNGCATAVSTSGTDVATSPGERFLLFVTVMLLPLESHIRIVPNASIIFLIFAVLAGYVAINRLQCLDRIWMHPVFVVAYLFIGISVAVEYVSPLSSYQDIVSFALMIAGAVLVASMCRDRAALKMLMYGYIGAALWLGALIFLTSYGALSGVGAKDFGEASQARVEAFKDAPIRGNLNAFAINCVQGGVVALAFALGSRGIGGRNFFAAIGIFCLVASSLPMSRGAIVNALSTVAVLLKMYGIKQGRVWLLIGLLAMGTVFLIPDSIWSRMSVMTEEGQKDSRVSLYESAIQHIDDYWFMGVGAGNYYGKWGFEKGFGKRNGDSYVVYGVHNTFLQLLINWGTVGLLAFVYIIWLAYRCLPDTSNKNGLEFAVVGIALTSLLLMPFFHDFGWKGFSLGLGMLVAYQRWLAPKNVQADKPL